MTEMRSQLSHLCKKLDRIDVNYTTEAIIEIRDILYELIGFVEMSLPEDKSDDD